MKKRGIYWAALTIVLLSAAWVTTGGAQVYPSRWYEEVRTPLPTTAFDSIQATTVYLVTEGSVPFECNLSTAGHLVVVQAPGGDPPTDPPTGTRSHYLCICAYVYHETDPPPHPGWMWALTDADNNPVEDCEPD